MQLLSSRTLCNRLHQVFSAHKTSLPGLADPTERFFSVAARAHCVHADLESAQLLRKHPMGTTGSSDGHEPEAIGCYYTEFPGAIETLAEFIAALRQRTGRPRHRPGAWQASGPVD